MIFQQLTMLAGISPGDPCTEFRQHSCKPKGSSILPPNPDPVWPSADRARSSVRLGSGNSASLRLITPNRVSLTCRFPPWEVDHRRRGDLLPSNKDVRTQAGASLMPDRPRCALEGQMPWAAVVPTLAARFEGSRATVLALKALLAAAAVVKVRWHLHGRARSSLSAIDAAPASR